MGIFDRLFRRSRPERDEHAPGLFTARSTTVPPELGGVPVRDEPPAPPEDLWDRPAEPEPVVDAVPEAEPAELAALDAFDPEPAPAEPAPAEEPTSDGLPGYVVQTVAAEPVEPLWDDATWQGDETTAEDVEPVEGSTAEEPLFADHATAPEPVPEPEPEPPLFDRPAMASEPPVDELVEAAFEPAPEPEPAGEEGRTMRVHDARLDRRPGPIKMTPSEALALAQDGPRALRRDRPHAES